MASGYTVFHSFNSKSTVGMDRTIRARFRTKDLLISDIYSSDKNFYTQEGIAEKADEILSVGLLSNLVVADIPSEDGIPYRLISGERRWRALCLLVERGYKEFETVTCQIRTPSNEHEEMIELILSNSSREKDIATLIREEQTLKRELQFMKDNKLELNGYDLQSGKLRDIVASIMNLSKTKIAEMEAVSNRLILDFKKELEKNHLTFSAAYQLSKLRKVEQEELYEQYQNKGELSYRELMDYTRAKEEEHKREQIQGQMSLFELEEERNQKSLKDKESKTDLSETKLAPVEEMEKDFLTEKKRQKQVDYYVMEFYRRMLDDEERELLHCNSMAKLRKRLEDKFGSCFGCIMKGFDFEWSHKKCHFNSGAKNLGNVIEMTLTQVIIRIIEILEEHPEKKILPGEPVQKDSLVEKKVDTGEENLEVLPEQPIKKKGIKKDVSIAVLQTLIKKELHFIQLNGMENIVSDATKIEHKVSLDAFRYYKKYLEEVRSRE